MSTRLKSIMVLSALALLSISTTSCMIWITKYLTPQVSGIVINFSESKPAEGYIVKFPGFEQFSKTNSQGFFKLNAITERRYFAFILPGSSVRYTPLAVYNDNDVNVAWGVGG